MAKQTINVGSAPDDHTGDVFRLAYQKCNANFTELYDASLSTDIVAALEAAAAPTAINPFATMADVGGGGATPALQAVTNVGSVTDKDVTVKTIKTTGDDGVGGYKMTYEGGNFLLVDPFDNIALSIPIASSTLLIGGDGLSPSVMLDASLATSPIIATFQNKNITVAGLDDIPTTATDIDALKRDGSNANTDVNIGDYSLRATRVYANGYQVLTTATNTSTIPDSLNKRYQTDAQQTNNDATSPIQGQINSKQATLVSGTNIKTVNGNSLVGTGDVSISTGIADAPNDASAYVRSGLAWVLGYTKSAIDTLLSGYLLASGNLSALASKPTARLNLGIDKITSNGNSNYTILSTDKVVATSATLTASRTWTLPLANSVNAGYEIIVADLFGGVTSANTLIVTRAGADTINASTSVTIGAPYAMRRLISDGASKWTLDAGVMRIADYIGTTLTVNKLLVTDANSKLEPSIATKTEAGYLSGVTSAIQSQLDAKSIKIIKQGYTQLTGVTGVNVLASLLIPADWLTSGDGFEIVATPNKSTTASAISFNIYHDTTVNGTTNAIATGIALATTNRSNYVQRVLLLDGTTLRNQLPVNSGNTIAAASTTAGATTTFTPTVNNYITITVNPTVTTEVVGFNQIYIRKL